MVSIKFILATAASFLTTISAHPLFKRDDSFSASATVPGLAKGTCWWRFHKSTVLDKAHCAVEDLKGNSHSVFAEIRYADPVGVTNSFARWENKGGVGSGMSYDTTFRTIGELRFTAPYALVQVCDNGPIDTCKKSARVVNPH